MPRPTTTWRTAIAKQTNLILPCSITTSDTNQPRLAEAYMYRGVLHVQQNNLERAMEDLATLKRLDNYLATELSYVIQNKAEKAPEKFFGVTKKVRK